MKKRHNFARIIVAVLAFAMLVNYGIPNWGRASKAEAAGSTKTALEITAEMGVGWNLGNSLDAHGAGRNADIDRYETYWGNPTVTRELITTVKEKGFNTIRIPVTWYEHVTEQQGANGKKEYVIDEKWMNRVEEVVKYAYDQGMYVILNIHHEEGYINRSDLASAYDPMSEYVVSLWKQIAQRFAAYDQHLIFEGMNEPRAVGADDQWYTEDTNKFSVINKLNEDFVKTVRGVKSEYQNTRLLMVPSYAASADSPMYDKVTIPNTGLDSNNDGRDDYVAVSIHAYKPYDYTMNPKTSHSEFTAGYDASLKSTINDICRTYVKKGIPVIIGEFSASNYGYDDARVAWANAYMTYAKEAGIPCVLWDNNKSSNSDGSEAHGYVNRSAIGTNDAKWYASGELVVNELLRVYNDSSVVWRAYADSAGSGPANRHEQLTDANKIEGYYGDGESFAIKEDFGNYKSGTELAIKYPDSAPTIELMDSSWGGWVKIGPDDVDEVNQIAYYSYDYVMESWGTGKNALNYIKITTGSSLYSMHVLKVIKSDSTDPSNPTDPVNPPAGITNPKMTKFSIIASGSIGIELCMEMPNNAARIKINGASGEITKDISSDERNKEYTISYTVAAKDIGKELTVTVYSSDGQVIAFSNTTNVQGGSYKTTISKALEDIVTYSESSNDLTALSQAIYNYGAVSAAYFKNDTSWVKNISGSQSIYSVVSTVNVSDVVQYAGNVSGSLPGDISYLGASLILEKDVTVRHYFKGNAWGYNILLNGVRVYPAQVNGTSDMYYIDVKDISPVDFDKVYNIKIDNWNCQYSVMAYGYDAIRSDSRSEIKAVTSAMYYYMKAAKKYFNK